MFIVHGACNLYLTSIYYKLTRATYIEIFDQLMNDFVLIDSITIGINEWLAPQISEHWP